MPTDVRALIDRIADALGPEATPERVERVARAVLHAGASEQAPGRAPAPRPPEAGPASGPTGGASRVVVTAYGHDQPGVLAAVTAELSAAGANILDVSQKVLQEYFTLVLVADLPAGLDLGAVRDGLQRRGSALGARVLLQHEELFQAMHRP